MNSNSGHQSIFFLSIQSFAAVWTIMRACGMSARNMLIPILFLLLILFFRFCTLNCQSKKICIPSALLSFLFSALCLFADFSSVKNQFLTQGLDNRAFQCIILATCAVGFFIIFFHTLCFIFYYAEGFTLKEDSSVCRHLPLFTFLGCLLFRLPYFLYEYPGVMTPDSINQFEQVLGMIPYSNHHPFAHTLTIGLFYQIGRLFTDDQNAALSFYTGFQMCFMAFSAAWMVAVLKQYKVSNAICLLISAFYALVPYHAIFAVTIWKDVLFSGAVLIFTTALLRLLLPPQNCTDKGTITALSLYLLSGIMVCLYRSNGWYAFLVSLPFLIYAFRKHLKCMLPLHLAILATVVLIKGPVMTAFHVTQPDFVESISIPLQQTARVLYEGKDLTAEELESVHKIIDTTYMKELYAPGFADNMKELVRAGNAEYLSAHKGEYFKLWFSLGIRYPSVYLRAYIDQTIGYWYPDIPYAVAEADGIIPNETGVYAQPLLSGPLIVKTKEILLKLGDMLPLYGLLFSMGTMLWISLGMIGILTVKKQLYKCTIFLPGLAVILTLFAATPVSSEFRYAYSLIYTIPLYLIIPFLREQHEDE